MYWLALILSWAFKRNWLSLAHFERENKPQKNADKEFVFILKDISGSFSNDDDDADDHTL